MEVHSSFGGWTKRRVVLFSRDGNDGAHRPPKPKPAALVLLMIPKRNASYLISIHIQESCHMDPRAVLVYYRSMHQAGSSIVDVPGAKPVVQSWGLYFVSLLCRVAGCHSSSARNEEESAKAGLNLLYSSCD